MRVEAECEADLGEEAGGGSVERTGCGEGGCGWVDALVRGS